MEILPALLNGNMDYRLDEKLQVTGKNSIGKAI